MTNITNELVVNNIQYQFELKDQFYLISVSLKEGERKALLVTKHFDDYWDEVWGKKNLPTGFSSNQKEKISIINSSTSDATDFKNALEAVFSKSSENPVRVTFQKFYNNSPFVPTKILGALWNPYKGYAVPEGIFDSSESFGVCWMKELHPTSETVI